MAMMNGVPDASWAPKLVELEIVVAAHHLDNQLSHVRRGEEPPVYPVDAPKVGAHWHVEDLEYLLSFEQVHRRPLHRTVREVIEAYRTDPLAMSVAMVDRLARDIDEELGRDLPGTPSSPTAYQQRIGELKAREWIGDHARSIPRGWLPYCERAARIGDSAIPELDLSVARTIIITERFSRLQWIVAPRSEMTGIVCQHASLGCRDACMACGKPGERDKAVPNGRTLMLCHEHRQQRRADADAFWQALFPGTPAGVPNVKL